jgi:amino acid permease
MLASALGTGMLNLPLRVEEVGVIPFILLIFISALLAYFGMHLMSKIIMRYKVSSYSEMVKKALSHKAMRFSESILIFYPWAIATCLQVIFAKFMVQFLHDEIGFNLYESRKL